ncbi:uncharacterized protein ACMZJ9_001177 [Mantella aurantiaca]
MPWYRQYFWLLLFGGIILFTAIISFSMICVCRTQLSKNVTTRIQKSFKLKKRHKSTVVKNNSIYHSSGPSKVKLPNQMEKDFAISENPISVLPLKKYAMVQMSPRLPPRDLYPENYAKKENIHLDIPNPDDRYSYASYDSVGSISEINYTDAAATAKPEYYARKNNINLDIPNLNDRYSYASYDSVGGISEVNYSNADASDREYLEVVPDLEDTDYDDVEINNPGSDLNSQWTYKPQTHNRPFNISNIYYQ